MPFLSLNNPRSRASLITALLLLEVMAILWLRESSPKDGSDRGSLFNPRSQQQQQHMEQEEMFLFQVKKHHVPATRQQQKDQRREEREERSEERDGRLAAHVVARSGKESGQPQDIEKTKDTTSGNSNRDEGSGGLQQQHKGHHHHRAAVVITNQSSSKRASERIKSKVSSLAAAAAASIPKARKVIKGNHNNKNNKNNKNNNGRNKSASKAKHPSEIKNQRGGFKSTQERKQAQLIPVLDEHGVTIEDHFISPRDSDGDGVPDYFVLLRPSGDNVMDLGLFDDDVVVPVPVAAAPAAAPPVVLVTAPPPVVPPKPPAAPEAVSAPGNEPTAAGPSMIAAAVDYHPPVPVMS